MTQVKAQKMALTKSAVDALPAGAGAYCVWDARQPGFCVRVTPGGSKSFYAVSRVAGRGSPVWVRLGPGSGAFDVAGLRKTAAGVIAQMAAGSDPNRERRVARRVRRLTEFFLDYGAHVLSKRKRRTAEEARRMWRLHIEPAFGRMNLPDISRLEVVKWHSAMAKDHPTGANRRLALLRHILNVADQWGELPANTNPAKGVSRAREVPKERYLTAGERASLDQALSAAEVKGEIYVVAAIRLLSLTGARLNEILRVRWEEVLLDRRQLALKDSKTGAKRIYLNQQAVRVLEALPRVAGNPFVIVGRKPGTHLVNLERPWQRIRRAAGLEDVRLHDLRHSFASDALMAGADLTIVGRLLGHRDIKTTQRYAHLTDEALLEATDRAATRIDKAGR